MKRSLLILSLAAPLLLLRCGDSNSSGATDGGHAASCTPSCTDGKICQGGTCVTAAADASDEFPPGPDASSEPAPDVGLKACAADTTKAQALPLDIYVMLDQSGSMDELVSGGGTRWAAVTTALKSFLNQPTLAGVSVGIQYFGLAKGGTQCKQTQACNTSADCGPSACGPCDFFSGVCGGSEDSCSSSLYAKPDVEIAPLPGAATSLIASINRHSPYSGTPTSAGLQGAIDHAKAWAVANPQHVVIDILATDGVPSECDTNQNNINAIAAAGVSGTPKILTFVIGVGASLSNLNAVAKAGGTNAAFIVDNNANVNQQFLDALNKIRGTALGCVYKLPSPTTGTPDYEKVNLQYTPGSGGAAVIIPRVADKTKCVAGTDAWYYDNAAAPKLLLLCDSTCTKVSADTKGEIDVLLGCKSVLK